MDINFDPGFIPHISAFVPNIEFMHNNLNNFTNFNQKKLQYRMYYPKLQKFLKTEEVKRSVCRRDSALTPMKLSCRSLETQ